MKKTNLAIAACLFELNGQAPDQIKLTLSGTFSAKDGRPGNGLKGWVVNADNATDIIAVAKSQQDAIVVDYEHQTLYTRENGQPAPAAAWLKNLHWRENEGIYADVEWTAAAKASIESKQYRYISPVFSYDRQTGAVKQIMMAALVNSPAIDGLEDLAVAHFNFKNYQEKSVDKETLILIGLDENSSEQEINQAIVALKSRADTADALGTEIVALKAKPAEAPDPAKFVPVQTMAALKAQVDALSTQINDKEHGELITVALADGRLLAAQEDWAKTLDVVALKAYLEHAQPIAALSAMQTGGHPPAETTKDDTNSLVLAANKYQSEQKLIGNDVDDIAALSYVQGMNNV